MAARDVVFVHKAKPRAGVVHRAKRRVGTAGLAEALGAEEAARVPAAAAPDTPVGFVALRMEVMRLLRSTGGRPGVPDAERRKIPVTDAVWDAVSRAAREMAGPGFHPSPAQVAGVMLDIAARDMARFAAQAERALRRTAEAEAGGPEAGAD